MKSANQRGNCCCHLTAGTLEYRDSEYESVEEYKNDNSNPTSQMVSNFLSRNSNGSLYLAHELLKHNLVEPVDMAWHTTYQISELGLEVLKNNL